MTRRRAVNDGLPHRVYERFGTSTYSIGHKGKDGTWTFRLNCASGDRCEIARLRREASRRALSHATAGGELETLAQLIEDWFSWQRSLPTDSTRKRAVSTLTENEREAKNLHAVFGQMAIKDIKPHHAFTYLDKCEERSRGAKGNKEISLLQLILQRAVRKGIIDVNPLAVVDKLPTAPSSRYVSDHELDLALTVGRRLGGASLIVALALMTSYLCVRRSVETLDLERQHIGEKGITWTGAKKKGTDYLRTVVIEWSPELRALIDEALLIQRGKLCTGSFIFGNMQGDRYTKGGWKSNLKRLMDACVSQAAKDEIEFRPFCLQDLRPKGVTDKLAAKHLDVVDATLHTSQKMIGNVYDRRRVRVAQPSR